MRIAADQKKLHYLEAIPTTLLLPSTSQ